MFHRIHYEDLCLFKNITSKCRTLTANTTSWTSLRLDVPIAFIIQHTAHQTTIKNVTMFFFCCLCSAHMLNLKVSNFLLMSASLSYYHLDKAFCACKLIAVQPPTKNTSCKCNLFCNLSFPICHQGVISNIQCISVHSFRYTVFQCVDGHCECEMILTEQDSVSLKKENDNLVKESHTF